MEWIKYFVVQNFILLCMMIVVVINLIQHFDLNRRVSICSIVISALTFLLALSITLESYAKSIHNIPLTTVFSVIGYIVRPVILYLFIVMSLKEINKKYFYLTAITLVINLIFFLLCFIPITKNLVVYFIIDEGNVSFKGGALRFTSHIIALGYLIWWFVISISKLRMKHLNQGITIIICALFVLLSVIIETFMNPDGLIFLLNSAIGLSLLVYFLYIYTETTQKDKLTNLFNRATFYADLPRMKKSVNAVVLFDINGLKYLNDNFGHDEGDNAIHTISSFILKHANNRMYGYRLGGDEFIILANNSTLTEITDYISDITKDVHGTKYSCSIGFSFKNNDQLTLEDLVRTAEENMYVNKDLYYKTNDIKRRK